MRAWWEQQRGGWTRKLHRGAGLAPGYEGGTWASHRWRKGKGGLDLGEAGDVVKVPTQRKQEVGDWCQGRGLGWHGRACSLGVWCGTRTAHKGVCR